MRYATCKTWADHFRSNEGVVIAHSTIRKRLEKIGAAGMIIRCRISAVLKKERVFSETDVREACKDVLDSQLALEDDSGAIEIEGVRYRTIRSLSRILGIGQSTIAFKIKSFKPDYIEGRCKGNRVYKYYSETEIRKLCGGLADKLPKADQSGFFELEGVRYGTIRALAGELKITYRPVEKRIKSAGIESIDGKDPLGRLADFYPEPRVKEACDELLNTSIPRADRSGFFEKDGIRFGSLQAFSRKFGLNRASIRNRIAKFPIQPVRGRNMRGYVYDYYSEPDIKRICADLIAKRLPAAQGFGRRGNSKRP